MTEQTADLTVVQWALAIHVSDALRTGMIRIVPVEMLKSMDPAIGQPDTITQQDCEKAAQAVTSFLGNAVAFSMDTFAGPAFCLLPPRSYFVTSPIRQL